MQEEIKKLINGEVLTQESEKIKYTRDTSIYEMEPEIVVQPKDKTDIKTLISYVLKNKKKHSSLSIACRAAGTCMSGGPLTESILLDFTKHFNHTLEIGNDYAIVEPGVYYRDFEKETLAKENLYFPSYPASRDLCAIGGIVNNNSGGEKTLQYGKTNKWVKNIHVMLSDGNEYVLKKQNQNELKEKMGQKDFEGELYRKMYDLVIKNQDIIKKAYIDVTKNSSGYNLWDVWDGKNFDLSQVFVGAQGTLGIMLDAKLKLVKKNKYEKLYVVFFKNLAVLPDFTTDVLKLKPTSLELTDDHTFKLYLRYAREMASILGSGGLFNTVKLFMPEVLLVLRHGIPKLVTLVQFEGENEKELDQKIKQTEEIVKKYGLTGRFCKTQIEANKYWKLRRDTFKLLRERVKDKHSTPFIDDLCVKPEQLPMFIPELTHILDRYKIIYTISGHLGDGNLHIIPLMDLSKPEVRTIIYKVANEVFDLTLKHKGTLTAEHNDGLIRGPYLEKEYGKEMFELFKKVKQIFDPENIFNPHKKTGATLEFAKSHMIQDDQFIQHHPHRKD